MSLRDELEPIPMRWNKQQVLDALGDDADEFLALLADRSVSVPRLWQVLRNRDIHPSKKALYNWRDET